MAPHRKPEYPMQNYDKNCRIKSTEKYLYPTKTSKLELETKLISDTYQARNSNRLIYHPVYNIFLE